MNGWSDPNLDLDAPVAGTPAPSGSGHPPGHAIRSQLFPDSPAVRLRARLEARGDCLVWTGGSNSAGYGQLLVGGKRFYTHRLAWELAHGAIPPGLHVLHRCDNPPCCNLAHLFLGSHADNMADMVRKGRHGSVRHPECQLRGEEHPQAVLTADQVREVLEATGSAREIARRFGVSRSAVKAIRGGRSWRHLERAEFCEDCGRPLPTGGVAVRCRLCGEGLRQERIAKLWREGRSLRAIATATGSNVDAVKGILVRMRAAGHDVPYRCPCCSAPTAHARRRCEDCVEEDGE